MAAILTVLLGFPFGSAVAEATSTSERSEVVELRTATSKTFRNGNGTFSTVLFAKPVHFRTNAGNWREIDSTLARSEQDGYAFANRAGGLRVRFKERLEGQFLRVEVGDVPFAFGLENGAPVPLETDATTARYRNVATSTDLLYDVAGDEVKETLVLKDAAAPTHFRFLLSTRLGGRPVVERLRDDSWRIRLRDEPGSAIVLRSPFATDRSDGTPLARPHATLTAASRGSTVALDLVVDRDWLRDPARRFPVRVDPTIEVSSETLDASFKTSCPSCLPDLGPNLLIGTVGSDAWRAAARFDLGDIPPGANITSASLKLYHWIWCIRPDGSCGGPHDLDVHKLVAPWSHASTSGDLKLDEDELSTFTLPANPGAQWMSWNVTRTVENWQHGLIPNHGLLVKRRTEPPDGSGPNPHSSRWHAQELHPRLEVTYTTEGVELLEPPTLHSNGADLAWTRYAPLEGGPFERYEVHRSRHPHFTPSRATLLATLTDVNATTYRDTTAAPSRAFTYRVVANGVPSNERTVTLPPNGQARKMLQPGPADGKATDLYWNSTYQECTPAGASKTLWVGPGTNDNRRALLHFGLGDIPAGSTIHGATLSLYREWGMWFSPALRLHRVTASWEEGSGPGCNGSGATWYERQGGVNWTAQGGDYDPTPVASLTIPNGVSPGWDSFEIASVVQQWINASAPNHGVLLRLDDEGLGTGRYWPYHSDDVTAAPTLRPRLTVHYGDGSDAIEPTVSISEPPPGGVKGTVNVTAAASDDRRVETVEFVVDGKQIASDQAPPFTIAWNTKSVANGAHSLSAKAIDDAGNATTSVPVQVTVGNSAPPQTNVRIAPTPAYANTVHLDRPTAYWRLGDPAGPTAADSSGNGHNGSYGAKVHPNQPGALTGDTNTSARFDGVAGDGLENDEVTVSDRDALDFGTGDFSVEAWVKTTRPGGEETIVAKYSSGALNRWRITITNDAGLVGRVRASIKDGGATRDVYGPAVRVDDGSWHHVVAVFDRDTAIRVYVDGHLEETAIAATGSVSNAAALQIGGDSSDDPPLFGHVDEVAVYPRVLTRQRVLAHHRAGIAGARNPYRDEVLASGPDSYFRLGEVPGFAYAKDESRNALRAIYEPHVDTGAPGALANDANTAAELHNQGVPSVEEELEIIDTPLLDFGTADFTTEAWVKTTVNTNRTIVSKCCRSGLPFWRVFVTDQAGYTGRVAATINDGSVERTAYGPAIRIDDNTWHHVAVAFERDWGIRIYVDGTEAATMGPARGDVSNSADFEIGNDDSHIAFHGSLDEVAVYPRVLPAARIRAHYDGRSATGYDRLILDDDPRGYWRLGEPVGWTKARDESPNNRDARYQAAEAGVDGVFASGDSDTAARFGRWSGETFVDLGDRYDFAGTAAFSVETWIKPTGERGSRRIVSKEDGTGGLRQGWSIYVKDSDSEPDKYRIGFDRYPNAPLGDGIVTPADFRAGEWAHVVATYDGSTMVIYVNGERVAIGHGRTQALPDNPRPFQIGGSDWADVEYFDGDLDEVAIYTRALTAREAVEHYDAAHGAGNAVAGTAIVRAEASDDVAVTKVEFLADGVEFAEDQVAPYEISWNTLDLAKPAYDGVHHLTTKAYDSHEQVTESVPVRVTVANAAGTPHRAALSSTTVPDSVSGEATVELKVTNTSNHTWQAGQMAVAYRWLDPVNPVVVAEGALVDVPAPLAPDGARDLTLTVAPPALAPGVSRAQYRLRLDVYDRTAQKWFERAGNRPLERLVHVVRTLSVGVGLERYYQYEGEELGAGMQHLANVASGNSLVRWTPFEAPGRGLSTVVDLTYNSQDATIESPLGRGWSLATSTLTRLGTPLRIYPDRVELVDGDGTLHTFARTPAGAATTKEPPGVHLYLRQTGSPDPAKTWAATRPDRVTFYFDADGNPTSVEDRNGNKLRFTLEPVPPGEQHGGAAKRITAVTDAAGVSNPSLPNRSFGLDYYSPAESPANAVWGRLQRLTDHTGSALDFEYFDDGALRRIVQRGGTNADGSPLADRNFTFAYTTARLTSVTDPRPQPPRATVLDYEPATGRLSQRTNRAGEQTAFSYDVPNRVTTVTKPLSRVTTYAYDPDGKPVRITNPKNETTKLIWSRDRHVTKVIEPTGAFVEYAYDDNGYLTDQFDELRNHSRLEYEHLAVDAGDVAANWADGRTQPHISQLVRKTDPKGTATQSPPDDFQWRFSYDEPGNLVKTTDPLGYSEQTLYHEDGTVSAEIAANGHKTIFAGYDANGLPTAIVEPTGATTRFSFDADGLLRWVQDPNHARYPDGSVTDPEDFRSHFFYDSFHRLGRQSAPKSSEFEPGMLICSSVVYDENDNVVQERPPHPTDFPTECAGGHVAHATVHSFDGMDRPTETVTPPHASEERKTTFSYDGAGRLLRKTLPKGVATGNPDDFAIEYRYDPLDRVVSESRLTGDQQVAPRRTHYCYDLAGDLRWATGARAGLADAPTGCGSGGAPPAFTTRFGYDAAHRIVTQQSPLGHTQTTAYDGNGQVESATDAQGTKQTNVYDERGQLVRMVQPFQQTANGKVTRSLTTKLEYDPAGNLVREMSPRAWDAAGDREEGFPWYVTSYDYDAGDRLVRVKLPDDEATRQAWVHHRFDPNGNLVWTSLPVDTPDPGLLVDAQKTQVDYFDPGWVKTITEPVRTWVKFDYTPRGEQAKRDPQGQANVETWGYHPDGVLRQNADPNGHVNDFSYDLNGNLTLTDDATGVSHGSQLPRQVQQEYNLFDELTETRQYKKLAGGGTEHLRTDRQSFDAHGNPLTRTDDVGGANERFHTFVHDDDDRLVQDFDDGLPGCADDQVLETSYLPNGWTSREAIRKRPATCEQTGWPTRQVTTYAYFRNGDLERHETFNGIETDPSNLVESHALSYVTDDGVYVNGHRLKDVFKQVGPGGVGPCAASACTATYAYDARDRLVSWSNGLPSGQGATAIAYTLDADTAGVDTLAGNVTREAVTENGQAKPLKEYVYSPAGQLQTLTEAGALKERYFYERGNLKCVTGPSESNCSGPTLETYSWDALDRLDRFTSNGQRGTKAQSVDYVYDAFDRPVRATDTRGGQEQPATTLEYLGLTDAVSNETRGAETKRYAYDATLSRTGVSVSGGPDPGSYTYGRNPRGDISLLLQETGGAKAAYGYRPYGEKDAGLFAGDGDDTSPLNPYRFNDRRLDGGSGSIDMGARRFAPDTGRFLEQDFYREARSDLELSSGPLTQNRYALAGGNPVSYVETDGHSFASLGASQSNEQRGRPRCEFFSTTGLERVKVGGRYRVRGVVEFECTIGVNSARVPYSSQVIELDVCIERETGQGILEQRMCDPPRLFIGAYRGAHSISKRCARGRWIYRYFAKWRIYWGRPYEGVDRDEGRSRRYRIKC